MDTDNTPDQSESKPKWPPRVVNGDESQAPAPVDHNNPLQGPVVKQTEEL